jgi:hypothetical protein
LNEIRELQIPGRRNCRRRVSVEENTDAKFISMRVDLDRIGFDEHSLRATSGIARQDESGSAGYRRSA